MLYPYQNTQSLSWETPNSSASREQHVENPYWHYSNPLQQQRLLPSAADPHGPILPSHSIPTSIAYSQVRGTLQGSYDSPPTTSTEQEHSLIPFDTFSHPPQTHGWAPHEFRNYSPLSSSTSPYLPHPSSPNFYLESSIANIASPFTSADVTLRDMPSSASVPRSTSSHNNQQQQQPLLYPPNTTITLSESSPIQESRRLPHSPSSTTTTSTGTGTTTASTRRAHGRDARPHVCHLCGAPFQRGHDLSRHLKSHENHKHACPHCGKTYTRSDSVRRHVVRVKCGIDDGGDY